MSPLIADGCTMHLHRLLLQAAALLLEDTYLLPIACGHLYGAAIGSHSACNLVC